MKATSTHKTSSGIGLVCLLLCILWGPIMAQPGKPATMTVAIQEKIASASQIQPGNASFPVKLLRIMGLDSVELSQSSHCKYGRSDTLSFATARLQGDTLQINLLDLVDGRPTLLKIEVLKDQFQTKLVLFKEDGRTEIIPTDQVLVLPRTTFAQGESLEGFVNFRGTGAEAGKDTQNWSVQKDWVPSTHTVRGPFKVTIR